MVDLFAGKTDSSNRFAELFVAQCVHDVCAGKLGKVNFKRASRCLQSSVSKTVGMHVLKCYLLNLNFNL